MKKFAMFIGDNWSEFSLGVNGVTAIVQDEDIVRIHTEEAVTTINLKNLPLYTIA